MTEPATILAALARHAADRPDDVALTSDDGSRTWSALNTDVLRAAGALAAAGVGAGERVAIVARNGGSTVVSYLAAVAAGGVAVPMPVSATPEVLARLVADCEPAATFADAAGRAVLRDAAGRAMLPNAGGARFTLDEAEQDWPLPEAVALETAQPMPQDALFNIIYSSGTTGTPKGIVHDHAMRNAQAARSLFGIDSSSVMLLSTPHYSNTTLLPLLASLFHGGRVHLMQKFDAGHWLEIAERDRATHTMLVPVQYRRILAHPDFASRDLAYFQVKQSTSAPMDEALKRAIIEFWPGRFLEVYGLTEGGVTFVLDATANPDKLHTVGKPAAGTLIRLVDPDGHDVAPGETGEIVGRSTLMMRGYWRRPEADAEIRWTAPDGHLYHRSGDLGAIDGDGFLILKGRRKDVIISGGFNIHPADLESVLREHSSIEDCAVIGVPSAEWGESPLALVIAKSGTAPDPGDLRDWANRRLGSMQRLAGVELVATLPRSSLGKVLKAELRAPYWAKEQAG